MAWTTPKTWAFQEGVESAELNTHLRDNLLALPEHTLARKTADESVVSSTTLQDDNHLFFAMGANETWYLRLVIWIIDNGAGNFKFGLTVPASGTGHLSGIYWQPGAPSNLTTLNIDAPAGGSNITIVTPSSGMMQQYIGWATTAGTAGNFQFQWAQGTSSGSSIVMKTGSFLSGYQIA